MARTRLRAAAAPRRQGDLVRRVDEGIGMTLAVVLVRGDRFITPLLQARRLFVTRRTRYSE
jgi:hypothetical protein